MSSSVFDAFKAFDKKLKLDPEVTAQARSLAGVLEQCLRDAGLCQSRLLQGSFGRKTMRPPLKDVDVVIVLPDRLADQRTQPGMSAWAMGAFVKAITDSGVLPGVRFDVEQAHAHALQLTIPGVDFTVDLVPAFETESPDDGWLYIADRDKDQWTKLSDVRRLRDKVAGRNQQCGGVWVNQVREAKHALDQDPRIKDLVCGLLMESLAYDAVTKKVNPQQAMVAIFTAATESLGRPYFGLAQDDLTAKWSGADRADVLRFFQQNHRKAVAAVRLESAGDKVEANRIWREVFGDLFPTEAVSFVERLKTVGQIGGSVTTDGRLTTVPGNARPARPWRVVAADEEVHASHELRRPGEQTVVTALPSMDALLSDPERVAREVAGGEVVWGVRDVLGSSLCDGYAVKLELDLLPLPDAADEGFEVERVRVVATSDHQVLVYPIGRPGRTWRHRNDAGRGALCLQYPGDDPSLLWLWEDGLEDLLTRVRLHLLAEEVFRREGSWPGEELPHGLPTGGVVWPVASDAMRRALRKWSR